MGAARHPGMSCALAASQRFSRRAASKEIASKEIASCELHPGSWSNTLTPDACAHVADTLVRPQTVGGPPHTGLLKLKSSACQRPLALCICVQSAASCV